MKKIKKIILIISIFILSGCSVDYNITINEDNTINEKVIATERTKKMESLTRLKGDNAVKYLYDMFKRDNEDINIVSKEENGYTIATVITSHNDIEEYSKKFKSDVFEKVNIEKKDGIVTIKGFQTRLLGENSEYSLIYDDIKVSITLPYVVTENNADIKRGNTYIWNISKSNKLKEIKLSYKEGDNKGTLDIKLNNKTLNISYAIIITSGIILLALIIIFVVSVKNKKNNVL